MTTLVPSMKTCACCEFWTGTRTVDTFCERVTVECVSDAGKCINHQSFYNCPKGATSSCAHFQKWGVLK